MFKEILIKARNKKGLNKKETAEIFGWTPMYYGRYESGDLVPNEVNLKHFADFIGLTSEQLRTIINREKGDLNEN